MPATATSIYIIKQNAPQEGLAFAMPSWWDVERLFEVNAQRRIVLPDGREVLLLDWPHILDFDLTEGKKIWNLPEREIKDPETEQRRTTLLSVVQEAEWFIVERGRVWMVPERARPGCEVWGEPIWWSYAYGVEDFREWYERFREAHRLDERYFEIPNPFWLDYVRLLTGPEARQMDEHFREAYGVLLKRYGQKLPAHHRQQMARFARALQQAEWVVLYDYEWESGLD